MSNISFNSRIIAGICSFGMSGKVFHAPFLNNHPGFELFGIVERSKNSSRELYPQATIFRSVEELILVPEIQLIVVNTPVQTHYNYAKLALLAGKHVIVEKPFTVTAAEARELQLLAQEKQLQLIIYQNRRYDKDFLAVQQVINSGKLGEVREAEFRFDRYRPEISYKLHKETVLPGAGNTYDLGAHLVDQAVQLFGFPDALWADTAIMRNNSVVDDYFEIVLFYPLKRVRLKATCFAKTITPQYVVHGSKGSFVLQRTDQQEQLLSEGAIPTITDWCPANPADDGVLEYINDEGHSVKEKIGGINGNYMHFYTDVYNTIVNNAANPVPAADGVQTITLLEAALQSSSTGNKISFI